MLITIFLFYQEIKDPKTVDDLWCEPFQTSNSIPLIAKLYKKSIVIKISEHATNKTDFQNCSTDLSHFFFTKFL